MKTKKTLLRTILIMAFLLGVVTQVNAQKIEIAPLIGYETGTQVHTNLGTLHIGDGMDFGGSVDVGLGGGRFAELSYTHLKSYLNNEQALNTTRVCDLAVDYYSIGILQEVRPKAKVSPYGLFTLGLVNYRPTTGGISSEESPKVETEFNDKEPLAFLFLFSVFLSIHINFIEAFKFVYPCTF